MASRNHGGGGGGGGGAGGEEQLKKMAELSKTLKEGERIVAPTKRPDGTFRKPFRIRAGYNPQDEVAIYQSKGALRKKEMESAVPPGYDPALDTKPKTKSAKRNERKEKRLQQAALEKGKNLEAGTDGEMKAEETLSTEDAGHTSETVKSLTSQMNKLDVTAIPLVDTPSADSIDSTDPDIDKKIRALKKKIRLAEEKQQKTVPLDLKPEQMDRSKKLESWRQELKCLEDKKAEWVSS